MFVKLIPVAEKASPPEIQGYAAIVFDVLRATSTITTALAAGYQKVHPVVEAEEAKDLARRIGAALAGERGGEKIPGFPHGNSPLEFWSGNNNGNDSLVLTTSNGTKAIRIASMYADKTLIGSLLNARAVALAALQTGLDICLVCAGTEGSFSLEDVLGAGFVLLELTNLTGGRLQMDDLPVAACNLARHYVNDPLKGLDEGRHGKKLINLGRKADLEWCARLNRFEIAPAVNNGYVSL
ncbi:2-phosphosulfolactate phosphatase [Desulfotruncus alcoholivorax]|uniref:2-phosphosulfolactate phosphatase n=1 Tax=Desulfotruncus alcoholivorax TaxID=265477 RepID=UPI000420F215|nr:2-phosphosulfolactate phosphatase [Desulfotruncus alcoholivorax]